MNKPTIGIRQADGTFYGIMEDEGTPRKRFVLSAAKSGQQAVKIDLYRSTDGLIDNATLVGSLDLLSDASLESQDITVELVLDEEAQLTASATLANGQKSSVNIDLAEFREGKRSDSDILADHAFDNVELDNLDDALADNETEVEIPEADFETGDADFEMPEVVSEVDEADLEFNSPPELTEGTAPELDDMDAEFGADVLPDLNDDTEIEALDVVAPAAEKPAEDEDSWHDFSMDEMEPMEFLDTGDEISAPKPNKTAVKPSDEFSMDDDAPVDLEMVDEPLGDLGLDSMPELGDSTPAQMPEDAGFDPDFMPSSELSESTYRPDSEAEKPAKPVKAAKPAKPAKKAKASPLASTAKPTKASPRARRVAQASAALDKTALVLSLITLSLLVGSLVVLLVLNLMRPPEVPVIQPEVRSWPVAPGLALSEAPLVAQASEVDLGAAQGAVFEANDVQELPAALVHARITLQLAPGETVSDATRRFGVPDKVEGELLSW